jgi:hypothetical protein
LKLRPAWHTSRHTSTVPAIRARRSGELVREALGDAVFGDVEDFLDSGESCFGIVVIAHQAVVVIGAGRDVVDHIVDVFHHLAAMLEGTSDLLRSAFEGAIEADGFSIGWALAIVGAIPRAFGI